MTKTKTQKMRRKAGLRGGMPSGKQGPNQKGFDFLNGNTFSFLNGVAAGKAAVRKSNLGRQARGQRISAPVSTGFSGLSAKAKITTGSSGVTNVKHSEYVRDIDGSLGFEADSNRINPGTSDLFPWLSTIAKRFESYKFKDLNFRYETTSPTNTAGTAIITVDYNPNGQVPASKTQALAMESAVRTPVWGSTNHKSLRHNLSKRSSYYVRSPKTAVPDADLYDTGLMIVMTEGVPSESGSIGELYVDYDVDLITPILDGDTIEDSVKVVFDTAVAATDGRFLFEVLDNQIPANQDLIQGGPGIHASVTVGTIGGIVGSFYFKKNGNYLVVFDYVAENGELDAVDFGVGVTNTVDGNLLDFVNITPGGTLALISGDGTTGMSMFAIRISGLKNPGIFPSFGIGFSTALLSPTITTTVRIADYASGVN